MINNPIQQIERTQDAYAGNPEGLQQRANMSKELIDLLAMQALQSDLAAQKRNMAMQQQGNPQTVKDQLEEGLMSEYRQEAAKDLGVGPSEGDVVERAGIAGQQMAQNAQMPQGPQGMPQGGGGVASQAGPVNLAGGGIVSFDAGGPTSEVGEFLESISLAQDENIPKIREGLASLRKIEKPGIFSPSTPEQRTQRGQLQVGYERAGDLAREIAENPRLIAEFEQLGPEAFALKYLDGASQGLKVGAKKEPQVTVANREAPLNMQEEEIKGRAATTPPSRDVDVSGIASLPTVTGPSLEEQGKLVKDRMARFEETAAAAKPPTAVVPPVPSAPAIDPDAGIKAALEKSANLDPVAQAKARSKAVKDDLGLAEGIATLRDRKGRRERAYEETTASGMDNLIDLLTAGGRGGITGVGARSGQLRREENARRMAYEDTLDGIEDKAMTLRSTIGGKAATSYDNTMKTILDVQQRAQNSLLTLSANEQKAIREERANNLAEARNDLSRENLLLNTVEGVEKQQEIITDTQQTVAEEFNLRYDKDLRAAITAVREGEDNAEEELKTLQDRISLEMQNDPRWVASEVRQEMIDGIAERNTALIKAQRERLGSSAISGDAGRLITAKKDG